MIERLLICRVAAEMREGTEWMEGVEDEGCRDECREGGSHTNAIAAAVSFHIQGPCGPQLAAVAAPSVPYRGECIDTIG